MALEEFESSHFTFDHRSCEVHLRGSELLLGKLRNVLYGKRRFQHELEAETQRVVDLIRQAEEGLEVRQRLLAELRGAPATQVELTMHVYREIVGDLIAHLAHLNELRGRPDFAGVAR